MSSAPPPPPFSAARAAPLAAEFIRLAAEVDASADWIPLAVAFDDCYRAGDLAGCRAAVAELARLHAGRALAADLAGAVAESEQAEAGQPCGLCGCEVYDRVEAGRTCPRVGAGWGAKRTGRCPFRR